MRKMYEYSKLRGRIVEKYRTFDAFAEALGVSRVTVSLKMNGKSGFSQEDIEEWSDKLDIRVSEYGAYFFA